VAFSGKRYIKRQSNPTNFRIVKEKLKMCVSSFNLPSALNNLISTLEDKQQSRHPVKVEIAGASPVESASNKITMVLMCITRVKASRVRQKSLVLGRVRG